MKTTKALRKRTPVEVDCDYCGQPANLISGSIIYPHRTDLHSQKFWCCKPCDAYVGGHKNSPISAPLGRLANSELRKWKQYAHLGFDHLWKSGRMKRPEAYAWLAEKMKIDFKDCHIGMFDVAQCKSVVQITKARESGKEYDQ